MDVAAAIALQRRLAPRVREAGRPGRLRRVAGVDVAYDKVAGKAWAAAVVCDYPTGRVVAENDVEGPLDFPYVPGLLSFREAPVCLAALEPLRSDFDCLLVDGQGVAHPRRFGLACHLGVVLNKPTIGCAKSKLYGNAKGSLSGERGDAVFLYGDDDGVVGLVLRTRTGVKPMYISVGHKARLDWAREVVLALTPRNRVPEPTRLAHIAVSRFKRQVQRRGAAAL